LTRSRLAPAAANPSHPTTPPPQVRRAAQKLGVAGGTGAAVAVVLEYTDVNNVHQVHEVFSDAWAYDPAASVVARLSRMALARGAAAEPVAGADGDDRPGGRLPAATAEAMGVTTNDLLGLSTRMLSCAGSGGVGWSVLRRRAAPAPPAIPGTATGGAVARAGPAAAGGGTPAPPSPVPPAVPGTATGGAGARAGPAAAGGGSPAPLTPVPPAGPGTATGGAGARAGSASAAAACCLVDCFGE
jgi:hypothetical protein